LYALGAFAKAPAEGFIQRDMTEEEFPLNLEGVVVDASIRNFGPTRVEIDWIVHVGIPDRFGGGADVLDFAAAQAGDGGAFGAVDLNGQEVIAAHTDVPGAIEMAKNTVFQFKSGVGAIVGGACIHVAVFVDPFRNMNGAGGRNGFHFAEQIVDEIAPVTEHIHHHATPVFFAVVPGGTLGRLLRYEAFEDPVAEFATDGEDLTKEPLILEHLQLAETGEPEFVLYHAVFQTGIFDQFGQPQGFGGFDGCGFFAKNGFARFYRLFHEPCTLQGAGSIKEDVIGRIGEGGVDVGRPSERTGLIVRKAVGQVFKFVGVPSGEEGAGHQGQVVADADTALFDDCEDGTDQMLIGSHASGDAVHDNADVLYFHNRISYMIAICCQVWKIKEMKKKHMILTKQQAAYHNIRTGIMTGKLRPGTRLVIDKIALELEVSAIPVREALSQLEKEGLVVIKPHAGAVVTDIPESAIEEIFGLLEALETASCRLGIKRVNGEILGQLSEIADQMDGSRDADQWLMLNRQFHQSLPRLTGLTRLEELMIRVGEDWERLRRLRFADRKGEDLQRANQQHRAFLQALKDQDQAAAEKIIQMHNREALRQYVTT
jgi:DNA-binding GntR family transcriptional regulator